MLGPKRVISVNETMELVKYLFSCCEETPDSCSSSWIAHQFSWNAGIAVHFAEKVVEHRQAMGCLN